MSQQRWSQTVPRLKTTAEAYLKRLVLEGATDSEIAKVLNKHGFKCTQNSVAKVRTRLGISKTGSRVSSIDPTKSLIKISESPYTTYASPPKIDSPLCLILPDVQFPYHHAEFLNRVLDLAHSWKIEDCVLAGDLIENSALTHFDPAWDGEANPDGIPDEVADKLIEIAQSVKSARDDITQLLEQHGRRTLSTANSVSEEWGAAKKDIATLCAMFKRKIWVLGNHEGRYLRQIQSPFDPVGLKQFFIGNDDTIQIAPYYYCEITSNGIKWRVIHPRSSGRDDPQIYASKFLCNVIMAHSHHWNIGKDRSGRFFAISTGCLVDERRLPYASQRDNKSFQHILGATIIRDGKAWVLSEDSDWDSLKKLKI